MFLQVSSSCVSRAVGPADATSGGGSKSGLKLAFYLTESVGDQPLLLVEGAASRLGLPWGPLRYRVWSLGAVPLKRSAHPGMDWGGTSIQAALVTC